MLRDASQSEGTLVSSPDPWGGVYFTERNGSSIKRGTEVNKRYYR